MAALDIFSAGFLDDLVARAEQSQRRRQHHNLHQSYADPVQRLFNAICPDSYIRPHRHNLDPKQECLMAVRGRLALILFDDVGAVTSVTPFGTGPGDAAGVELSPGQWHSVVALQSCSILLEIKPGPFDPSRGKEPALWSPEEGAEEASVYLARLHEVVRSRLQRDEP